MKDRRLLLVGLDNRWLSSEALSSVHMIDIYDAILVHQSRLLI
jgi:hypothetical protein